MENVEEVNKKSKGKKVGMGNGMGLASRSNANHNFLPKQFVEKNKGMFLFDFQTVNFQASKKDPSIAETHTFQELWFNEELKTSVHRSIPY